MIDLLEKTFEEKYCNKQPSLAQSLLEGISLEDDYKNILVLILRPNYSVDYSNIEMFSIRGIDYIINACTNFETKVVDFDLKDDVIEVIKQNVNQKKYVLAFFSDTPLLTKKTVLEIVDYFLIKKLCSLKFNRGYMFETEYLKNQNKIYNPLEQNFFEEDFVKVCDSASFSHALNILKHRIISYHQANGVLFLDPSSCFVDALANIEKNVVIGENVKICGKSIIKEFSRLENCKLNKVIAQNGVEIENSIVENSVLMQNSKVTDFSVIKNQTINENEIVCNKTII